MPISEWLDSFPARLGVLTAAVAAISGLLFPKVLIPDNLSIVGPAGSVLVAIVFLVCWAIEKFLWRQRKIIFAVAGAAAIAGLVMLVLINTRYVVHVQLGDEPPPQSFIVGSTLTAWGRTKWRESGSVTNADFVRRLGHESIEPAWGESLFEKQTQYMAAYLVMGMTITLMMAVALAKRP